MGRCSELLRRTCVLTTLLLAILLAVSLASFAQTKTPDLTGVEKDNPFERLKAQEREYGKVTPAYRDKVLKEAQKQNEKLNRNTSGVAEGTPGQPTTGPKWINIGPFGQQFGQNGTYTGNDLDSGRLRTILVHPTDPNIVYILSSAGGLWKTTNFNDAVPNWTPKTDFLPTTAGGAAAFGKSPNTIYLGLGDPYDLITVGGSIVKSTDGGDTWSPLINLGLTVQVRDVKADTSGTSDVVLVATDGGLWRSSDSGATYAQVLGNAFQDQYIWSLAKTNAGWIMATQETQPITNGSCTVGLRWCTGAGHIYLSTDKGATWNEQTNGLSGIGRTTLAVGAPGDSVIYALAAVTANGTSAATNTKDLYRSEDGGKTWVALGVNSTKAPTNPQPSYAANMNVLNGQAWYNQAIGVDPSDETRNTVYIGGTYYSAKSSDGGASWKILTEWLPGWASANGLTPMPYLHADMHAMAFQVNGGTTTAMIGSDGGLFITKNGGDTWDSSKNTNLVTHMFYTLIGNPLFPNFVMGGLQDNGTRVRVDNTGIFNQSNGGDGFGVGFSQSNAETALQSVYNLSIRRGRTQMPPRNYTEMASSRGSSSDGGFYTPIYSPMPGADPTGLVFFAYGAATTTGGVYRTTNGGIGTWTTLTTIGKAGSGLPGGSTTQFRDNPFGFGVSPTNINHMAIGANAGRCFVSLDGGITWVSNLSTDTVQGWPGFVGNVTWATDNIIYVTSTSQTEGLYTGVPTVRVVKSVDQGLSWTAAGAGLPDVPVNKVQPDWRDATGNTLYAATQIGVYRTTDGGASWTPYGAGLPNVRVNDLYMPPDGGYLRIATYGRGMWQLSSLDYVGAALVDDGLTCDHNGSIGNNETGHLNVTISNPTSAPITGAVLKVTSDNPHLMFTAGTETGLGTVPANYGTATGSLAVKVSGASGIEIANLTITYGDVTITRPIAINFDDNANASGTAVTWESSKHGWTINGATPLKDGDNFWFERRELTPLKHTMAVVDANGDQDTWLKSPQLKVGAANFSFSFNHRFVYENTWDGGILEISTDGTTFTQIPAANITIGAYNGTLLTAAQGNSDALAGLSAWTNQSTSWPAYTGVTVDLGTAYANQNVYIRLRSGADSNGGRQGWEISDMTFTGLTNTPFGAIVAHNEVCGATTASMLSTANPSNYPDQVTLTATVAGGVTPVTGTVNFKEGAIVLGSVSAVDGVATFNTSSLTVGSHYIVASFAGDSGHAAFDATAYKHTVLAVARTTMTPPTIDFGDVHAGQTSTVQTSVLKNTGTSALIINSIVATGDFTQTNNCSTSIAANGSCTITVMFAPGSVQGTRTGAVTLSANGVSGDSVLNLTGNSVRSVATASKTSMTWQNTLVAASSVQTVTVTNTGNLPMNVTGVSVSGTSPGSIRGAVGQGPAAEYTETNDCTVPLAAGEHCTVSITFTPSAAGNRPGTLTVTTDADNTLPTIALTGIGELLQITGTTTQTVSNKSVATYPLTLKASSAVTGAVSLACSGAPQYTTCAVTAPTFTAGTASVSVTVTPAPVTTTSSIARTGQAALAMFGLFGLMLLPLTRKQSGRKVLSTIVIALMITASVGGMVACGSSSTPPAPTSVTHYAAPGTYSLTITATSGGTTLQTQTLTLTLQ